MQGGHFLPDKGLDAGALNLAAAFLVDTTPCGAMLSRNPEKSAMRHACAV